MRYELMPMGAVVYHRYFAIGTNSDTPEEASVMLMSSTVGKEGAFATRDEVKKLYDEMHYKNKVFGAVVTYGGDLNLVIGYDTTVSPYGKEYVGLMRVARATYLTSRGELKSLDGDNGQEATPIANNI